MIVEPSERDMSPGEARDRALVEAHCSGDPDAFAAIVSGHYRVLLAQAERRLGSRPDAEDAVQETFERAFRAVCRLGAHGEYRLGAWLSRILANVCNDHGGRRANEWGASERLAGSSVPSPDAFEAVSDPSVLRAVHEAIQALPAAQRDTFLLKEMDGLSYDQVAGQLEISKESARARVHRAKAALQRSLSLTRGALGGLVAVPIGLRSLFRRAPHGAPAATPELGMTSTASNVASQVAASPVAQTLVAVAPTGAFRGVATLGVAALALTGALAVPAITSDNGTAPETKTESSTASAVTQSAEVTTSVASVGDAGSAPVTTDQTAPTPVTPPPTTVPEQPAAPVDTQEWWTDDEVAPLFSGVPVALPAGSPCQRPDGSGGVRAAAPARVVSRIDLAPTALSPDDEEATFKFSQSAEFAHDDLSSAPLVVSGQVCLQGGAGVLRVLLQSAGKSAHLDAQLVSSSSGDHGALYFFRGTATADVGDVLPWETRPDFLAKLVVTTDDATGKMTAQLAIAFSSFDGSPQGDVYSITAPPPSPGTDAPTTAPAKPATPPSGSGSDAPTTAPAVPSPGTDAPPGPGTGTPAPGDSAPGNSAPGTSEPDPSGSTPGSGSAQPGSGDPTDPSAGTPSAGTPSAGTPSTGTPSATDPPANGSGSSSVTEAPAR